ncbi:succinate dehydrogenase [ubiquinone] cytochrome b small subunit B, mitochondrial-like isoform X2 [Anneissia japonica]|uniref:succinate dehydrogenase [ubiquinone] cytochrome b small subunit B, mitochondrial-like isoform X2 n=1 Tax=Anneissia japonica TaxID=1529436 RepID=UPI001425659D|nr:succinate dehydrogenase [ubiquinone] cytochrome b small subunit B, mitochondrial-like isoform X2 [Anneissia japonica]
MAMSIMLRGCTKGLSRSSSVLAQSGFLASKLPSIAATGTTLHTSPQRNSAGMMSSTHWKTERVVSIGLLGVIPAALAFPNPALDYALAASLVLHCHWGMEQVFTDYVHGPTLPKFVNKSLLITSSLVFASLCYFNFNDVGLAKAIAMLWAA